MNPHEEKKLEVIVRAEELQDWVFRVTSKRPKKPESEFESDKNNGLPAKYQYSIGTRMQNYTLDIIESLNSARYDKKNRLEHLNRTMMAIGNLKSCIWLCFRQQIIRVQSLDYGNTLADEVKRMTMAWRESTLRR